MTKKQFNLLAASERGVFSFASSHSTTFIKCLFRMASPIASFPTPFWSSNAFTYVNGQQCIEIYMIHL